MFALPFVAVLLAGITQITDGSLVFTKEPQSIVYVKKGNDAVLKWEYYIDQKPAELKFITWSVYVEALGSYKKMIAEGADGIVINHPELPAAYVNRVNSTDQATLIIKNVTFEDSTNFRCTITAKSGDFQEDTVQLIVTGSAVCKPRVQFVEFGDSVTITCNATGVPSENRTCTGPKLLENNCSQFTIPDIPVSKAGHYSCNATLNSNEPNVDTCFVEVLYPPRQDNRTCTKSLFCATMNESLSICCPVRGYPPPLVTWEKNGTQLPQENKTVLTITSVKDKDLGNYTCTAMRGETTIGPFIITVTVCKCIPAEIPGPSIIGTVAKAAKLEWEHQKNAEFYVVKISGEDIRDDYLVGTQTSLEFYFNALVTKKPGERPKETRVCANVTAMNEAGVVGKTPTCQYITIKSDTET